jgi:hypothetical protein
LDDKSETEVMYRLYDQVNKLFTRQIQDAHLIIYTGVNNIMDYPKRKDSKNKMSPSNPYVDSNKEPIMDPDGPLDPRLVYGNLPQVLLTLKMLRRGDDVPPNTRLEYIYLDNPDAVHQGEKAEDYTYYRENRDVLGMKPDYFHYIEKQLVNPITELLTVKFPHERVPYEKLDDAFDRCISGLNPLLKSRVLATKTYTSKYNIECNTRSASTDGVRVGWETVCSSCIKLDKTTRGEGPPMGGRCRQHQIKTVPRLSKEYKKQNAQVQYILDSARTKKKCPDLPHEIDGVKYSELVNVCWKIKSADIMERLYKQFSLKKKLIKRPTQTGEKLRLNTSDEPTQVLLTKKLESYNRNTLATLIDIKESPDTIKETRSNKKKYLYSIKMEDGHILNNIPRNAFTTFYWRDSRVLEDILYYRQTYRSVMNELTNTLKTVQVLDLVFPE